MSVTKSFVQLGSVLLRGNQLLASPVEDYDRTKTFRQSKQTLDNFWLAMERLFADAEAAMHVKHLLEEYAVLDVLTGNTDRHDENSVVLEDASGGQLGGQWHLRSTVRLPLVGNYETFVETVYLLQFGSATMVRGVDKGFIGQRAIVEGQLQWNSCVAPQGAIPACFVRHSQRSCSWNKG